MVDTLVLGTNAIVCAGSSPALGTNEKFLTEDGLAPLKGTLAYGSNYPISVK